MTGLKNVLSEKLRQSAAVRDDFFGRHQEALLAVVEAVAEYKKDAKFAAPAAKDVREFVAKMEKIKATEKQVAEKVMLRSRVANDAASFETYSAGKEIHRGYHKKVKD